MQPPPSPRSPPLCPDFCGRRRLQLEVQILSREIGFLEEELQSLEGIQPVSRSCKEVNEFVGLNPDPLIPIKKKRRRSCLVWRWLRSNLCICSSWLCFSTGCLTKLSNPCCTCRHPTCRCRSCCSCCYDASCCKPGCTEVSCCSPKCCTLEGFCCHSPCCFPEVSLCTPGCSLGCLRCPKPKYSCRCPKYSCGCMWSCARCAVVLPCSKCTKTCCVSGCLC